MPRSEAGPGSWLAMKTTEGWPVLQSTMHYDRQ